MWDLPVACSAQGGKSCRIKVGRKRGMDVVRVEDKEASVETHGVFHTHKWGDLGVKRNSELTSTLSCVLIPK